LARVELFFGRYEVLDLFILGKGCPGKKIVSGDRW
jgi:hypothetical protein